MSKVIFDGSQNNKGTGHDVNEASLEAFERKLENGSIESDKAKVYQLIRDLGPVRSKEILKFMDKNSVSEFSGRITELKKEGLVESSGLENGENLWKVKQGEQ